MKIQFWRQLIATVTSVAVLTLGFTPVSMAGVIETQQLLEIENRQDVVSRIEAVLVRDDVARQLVEYGVDPADVMARVEHMTTAELLALDGQIAEQTAGGADALVIIGVVFLVLLLLDLVGVTDVFKSI